MNDLNDEIETTFMEFVDDTKLREYSNNFNSS